MLIVRECVFLLCRERNKEEEEEEEDAQQQRRGSSGSQWMHPDTKAQETQIESGGKVAAATDKKKKRVVGALLFHLSRFLPVFFLKFYVRVHPLTRRWERGEDEVEESSSGMHAYSTRDGGGCGIGQRKISVGSSNGR